MSVQPGPTEKRYAANGITTAYTIPFLLIEAGDLQVYVNGVLVTSGFTITGLGNPSSTITFTVAPSGGLLLNLNVPFQRLVDYQENGDFLASTVNRDFDRIWQALKQLLRVSTRALTLGAYDVDGAGKYRAKGNRIIDLADPVDQQDAATLGWASRFVGDLITKIQGPINNAANIFFLSPRGTATVVQDMSNSTDPNLGAGLVARAIRHINGLAELATVPGRYNGDSVRLVGEPGKVGGWLWNSTSTATADGVFVVQVSGVPTGRWVRDIQEFVSAGTEVTTGIGVSPLAESVRLQAMYKAERIRRNAGLQPWVILGPFDITAVGNTADARTTQVPMTITSAASAAALAAAGTGTQADPYIIRHKTVTFASGTPALTLNDPAATYYVRFYNVRFQGTSNGSAAINHASFGTPVAYERCAWTGGSGSADEIAIQLTSGTTQHYGCDFSGMSGQIFVGAGLTAKKVYMSNCTVRGTAKVSSTNGVFWASAAGDFTAEIYNCSFTSSHFHWHIGNGWTIKYTRVENTLIQGCAVGIGDLTYQKPGGNILSQTPLMIGSSYFKNVRFAYVAGVTQTACYGNGADAVTFEHCSFEGNVADRRLFEWRRTSNVTMLQCYFAKALGNNTAGNEVCEFWETAGLTVRECWANGAPEDCYELVTSYGNNRFIDNVADGVAGQCVDIFGVGAFDVEIDGVYGDCGDAAVLITDVDYVRVTNVFVKQNSTSALGSVVLERRNAAPGVSPKGCVITGFLSLPGGSSRGKPFAVDTTQAPVAGDVGQNFATWWENGELKTYGAATPARLTLR